MSAAIGRYASTHPRALGPELSDTGEVLALLPAAGMAACFANERGAVWTEPLVAWALLERSEEAPCALPVVGLYAKAEVERADLAANFLGYHRLGEPLPREYLAAARLYARELEECGLAEHVRRFTAAAQAEIARALGEESSQCQCPRR